MMTYFNKLNYSLIKLNDLNTEEDNLVYNLLYLSYICFFGALFLTNDFFRPYQIFLFVVIPLSIIPIYIDFYRNVAGARRIKFDLSLINPLKTFAVFRSSIFVFACVYGAAISISSIMYPSPSIGWFLDISKYLASILFFLAISSRLTNQSKRDMEILCALICLIVTINAAFNIYLYFIHMPNIYDFTEIRFTPSLGRAPDRYPTTCALTYALFFGIASCLIIQNRTLVGRAIFLGSATVLLFATILTQSRGPLVASFLALTVISFFLSPKMRDIVILIIGLIVSGFLLIPKIGLHSLQRGENARFDVWKKFFALATSRPIFGYGERIEFHVEIINSEIIGHAHNIYLSALIRGGIIAFGALISTLILSLKYAIIYLKSDLNFIPFSAILTLAVAGCVDFDLIVFLSDWQWPSIWFVIALGISSEIKEN